MKQLSIIIPTYNMEGYIGRCLESLLISEIDEVEVLVVNDGSKDCSSEIAHSYADRYPQSIRVIDKANGNYGSCVNAALPVVTGRYVKVLDADDSFDTTAFSSFVRMLPELNDDVLITPFVRVDEAGCVKQVTKNNYHIFLRQDKSYTFEQAYKRGYIKPYIEMHALSYKKDLFERFDYRQTEGISFTDTEWATFPMAHAETLRFVRVAPIYRYLVGREGQTMDSSRFRSQLENYFVLIDNGIRNMKAFSGAECGRQFALSRVLLRMNLLCMWIRGCEEDMVEKVAAYDRSLRSKSLDFYNNLADYDYLPGSGFKYIRKWRASGYDRNMKFPMPDRICMFIGIRVRKLYMRDE